jgi:hypothetical protein
MGISLTEIARSMRGRTQEELGILLLGIYREILRRRKDHTFQSKVDHEFMQSVSGVMRRPDLSGREPMQLNGGFRIGLGNGRAISIQFHEGNYITNRRPKTEGSRISSPNAEIAIFDHDGEFMDLGCDQVLGHITPDAVVAWLMILATLPVDVDAQEILDSLRLRIEDDPIEED